MPNQSVLQNRFTMCRRTHEKKSSFNFPYSFLILYTFVSGSRICFFWHLDASAQFSRTDMRLLQILYMHAPPSDLLHGPWANELCCTRCEAHCHILIHPNKERRIFRHTTSFKVITLKQPDPHGRPILNGLITALTQKPRSAKKKAVHGHAIGNPYPRKKRQNNAKFDLLHLASSFLPRLPKRIIKLPCSSHPTPSTTQLRSIRPSHSPSFSSSSTGANHSFTPSINTPKPPSTNLLRYSTSHFFPDKSLPTSTLAGRKSSRHHRSLPTLSSTHILSCEEILPKETSIPSPSLHESSSRKPQSLFHPPQTQTSHHRMST